MGLEYVGPKPIISHTGVEFDTNKEDKFIYLNSALKLLQAFNHNYFEDKKYFYDADSKNLNGAELLNELRKYLPDISTLLKNKKEEAEKYVSHNLQRAQENLFLKEEDKNTLLKNIQIMKDCVVQRYINKHIYYAAIDKMAELLKHEHVGYIAIPMTISYAHVLHSLQGSLKRQFIETTLSIYKENDTLSIKLQIINS